MGRAQVVQAQAAKLAPDVRMNPILLKPNSDVGSQVIVHGRPVGNMTVKEYVRYKKEAQKKAHAAFDSLASEYRVILLEGAGSPGEVNLKRHDIVNMQMARYANSPVLLVGDIDRGGVYASFIGTMEVLEEWERALVQGFLVNKFRGDATLLHSAHDYVFSHTGKGVLGTIPYIDTLNLPEEDSVSFKEGKLQRDKPLGDYVEVALINLPHISNFTDIEPFLEEPDVYVRIVHTAQELRRPDAIILPGSKNVIGDLQFLKESGLAAKICDLKDHAEIVGICGGYMMLGLRVADPHHIESEGGVYASLGLLDIETELAREKTLVRKEGMHSASGLNVHGYEIHHGISKGGGSPVLLFTDGSGCGAEHPVLPLWGSYLHGLFDSDTFRRWFIDKLRRKKGLAALGRVVAPYNLEMAFDTLADIVEESCDMKKIYTLLDI
ncbi:unnamed protein product [Cyprideis torosa]|uniref:Uncharacterized protein n=1 Tax=Cyprideis torosa TaxID=163714 RepID=A0A7R8WS87_9CRUS|nr:unnamed protein product [Cyprideis torosa]CAG0907997.1 unnamed protein product [Cyprideis torosa]